MIDKIFAGELMSMIQRSLDAGALQHRVLSNNLANVDTPGFKRSEVVFQDKLKAALENKESEASRLPLRLTHPNHISNDGTSPLSSIKPSVVTENQTTMRNDGNNVDIDTEMAKLSENTVYYNTLAQIMAQRLTLLRSAIREGK
jgi:flagellar basal-body rod protein FlgB